jgi:hypothetical protein
MVQWRHHTNLDQKVDYSIIEASSAQLRQMATVSAVHVVQWRHLTNLDQKVD